MFGDRAGSRFDHRPHNLCVVLHADAGKSLLAFVLPLDVVFSRHQPSVVLLSWVPV